jgi:hypothetical protein
MSTTNQIESNRAIAPPIRFDAFALAFAFAFAFARVRASHARRDRAIASVPARASRASPRRVARRDADRSYETPSFARHYYTERDHRTVRSYTAILPES